MRAVNPAAAPRAVALKVAIAAGLILGLLLAVSAVRSYRMVTRTLVVDHLILEAVNVVTEIEREVRRTDRPVAAQIAGVLDTMLASRPQELAWLRVVDQRGAVVAQAGEPASAQVSPQRIRAVLEAASPAPVEVVQDSRGDWLVVLRPLHAGLGVQRPPAERGGPPARPRFLLAEVGLRTASAAHLHSPLRRRLLIEIAAALALLGAMVWLAVSLGAYMRARTFVEQLDVARQVQRALLPQTLHGGGQLEWAAAFVPVWEVGGDYYDVFDAGPHHTAILLGDVSGKGLPAALLMGLLHGAVRSLSQMFDGTNHARLVVEVNRLLCERSASNRFVTLFWAFLDKETATLSYVNCGHLPAVLVDARGAEPSAVRRLPPTGPVLGLLPGAQWTAEQIPFEPGSMLTIFSDGLTEAESPEGEEFGDARVLRTVLSKAMEPGDALTESLLSELRAFSGPGELPDDVSILVLRHRQGGAR